MLTNDELRKVIEWIREYPKGNGHSWFSDKHVRVIGDTANRLTREPGCVKYG